MRLRIQLSALELDSLPIL